MSAFTPEDLALQINQYGPGTFSGTVLATDMGNPMHQLVTGKGLESPVFMGVDSEGYNLAGAIVAADPDEHMADVKVRRPDGRDTVSAEQYRGRVLLVAESMPTPVKLTDLVHAVRRRDGTTVDALAVLVNNNAQTETAARQLGLAVHSLLVVNPNGLVVPAGTTNPVAQYRSLTADSRDAQSLHARTLGDASIEHRGEPFVLKHGGTSNLLVNLPSGGHANAQQLVRTGELILDVVNDRSYDVVVGTGIDGSLVVSGVLLAASKRNRKDLGHFRTTDDRRAAPAEINPKNGYGFRRRWIEGKRVLAVEGTCTTGGSLKDLVGLIREAGGIVTAAVAVVDRSGRPAGELAMDMGVDPQTSEPVEVRRLFTLDEESRRLLPAHRA